MTLPSSTSTGTVNGGLVKDRKRSPAFSSFSTSYSVNSLPFHSNDSRISLVYGQPGVPNNSSLGMRRLYIVVSATGGAGSPQLLTNSRQRIAHQHIDHPCAAVKRSYQNGTAGLFADFADDSGQFTAGRRAEGAHRNFRQFRRNDREELPFIRDV